MKSGDAAPPSPLAELLRHIEQTTVRQVGVPVAGGTAGAVDVVMEPGQLRYFRSTWWWLRVARQLTVSQAQLPDNAGPLNSDRLVLRALHTLRDLSPAYLNRYMVYVDALMALDQARAGTAAAPVKLKRRGNARKRKAGRGKAE